MGENVIICQLINGVRFIDKTKIGGWKKEFLDLMFGLIY